MISRVLLKINSANLGAAELPPGYCRIIGSRVWDKRTDRYSELCISETTLLEA